MGTLAHTTTSNGIECSSTDWTGASTHLIGGVAGLDIITTAETQTLTSKTLTSPVIQGTVTAGAGLTMPAFSVGANYISFGASGTTTYNHRLVWRDETYLALQDGDGGYDAGFFLSELRFDVSTAAPTYGVLLSKSGDDYGVEFAGYTTAGIGEYERVAYLNGGSRASARRPTFDITRGKLTGALDANGQNITGISSITLSAAEAIKNTVDNSVIAIIGGSDSFHARLDFYGADEGTYPGRLWARTSDAAKTGVVDLFYSTGSTDTPAWTWGAALTHTNIKLTGASSAFGAEVLATGAGKTVDNVITALQNLGLVTQS